MNQKQVIENMWGALSDVAGAIEVAYGIDPSHDSDVIYDSTPTSALAVAYFRVIDAMKCASDEIEND